MLKSSRVKTQFYEDSRMSGACQMWHVGIFLAPSFIILKNMYIPVGVVQGWRRYHFEDRNTDIVRSYQNFLLSLLLLSSSSLSSCVHRYIQCMHQKLYHLTTADYEDFVNIVCSARAAFQITPEGNTQFKEWLQSIRRYDDVIYWYRIEPQMNLTVSVL